MKVLALDPSSSCTGYGLLNGPEQVLCAGRIVPTRAKDDAWTRITTMADEVGALIAELRPEHVVLEVGGKVHARIKCYAGAGQAVYGQAVGAVCREVHRRMAPGHYTRVEANTWTRRGNRQTSKQERQGIVAALVPGYSSKSDPGGDVADAVCLGMWWMQRHEIGRLANRGGRR